jgi:hypothetical protein
MATYHFDPASGEVGSCQARSISSCAFGSIDNHFTSALAAQAAYEEFSRQKRNALDKELLGHGDRIHLRSPDTGQILDAVIDDTGYNLLIVTSGANAPTNDVKSLIEYGWTLEKRIGATGEFSENPEARQAKAQSYFDTVYKELTVVSYRAGELRERLKNEASNGPLKDELKSYEDRVGKLRAESEQARLKLTEAVYMAQRGDKAPGFRGLHDVPYGFTGEQDSSGAPRYVANSTGSVILESHDGYSYFQDYFSEPIRFESFGEAIQWARREAAATTS